MLTQIVALNKGLLRGVTPVQAVASTRLWPPNLVAAYTVLRDVQRMCASIDAAGVVGSAFFQNGCQAEQFMAGS